MFDYDMLRQSYEEIKEEHLILKNSQAVLDQITRWNYKLGDPIS